MPRAVLNPKEIDELERRLRIEEVINISFQKQFLNPVAFSSANGTIATFTADKDYAILAVACSVATESETTPLAGLALLTYQNIHNHFPSNNLVQGDVIFSQAFRLELSAFSGINPRNSYLEKTRSITAHCHNPTADGKTTFIMQVSLLPVYKQ